MTDQHSPLRYAKLEDLKAIVSHAANHPAEREKLVNASEDVLRQAGLEATPQAVEFIKSLGHSTFHEEKPDPNPSKEDPITKSGEM